MSRLIDESKPLSEQDRKFLEDRGQYHVIERIERGLDTPVETETPGPDDGLSEAERKAGKAYDRWTVAELEAEVSSRNEEDGVELSPASGKKSDLIECLRDDDADLAG